MDIRRLSIATAIISLTLFFSVSAHGVDIAVITSGDIGEEITVKKLERIFLKRKTFWKNGNKIVPINLPSGSKERAFFTEEIIKRGHRELVDYWNARHYSGIAPPMVAESEEAVKIFVREIEGSIGYVSAEGLSPELKVLYFIRDDQ